MARTLIALGSSLGDRAVTLDAAVEQLQASGKLRIEAHSRWWSTRGVGGTAAQVEFLNGVLVATTDLSPKGLLALLQAVENRSGRTREARWAPRTLDLDLLLYNNLALATPALTVPHPRMSFRRFVLDPACEVAPDWVHPICGWTLGELRTALDRQPRWVAIVGSDRTACDELAQHAIHSINAHLVSAAELELACYNTPAIKGRWLICTELPSSYAVGPVLCVVLGALGDLRNVPRLADRPGVLRTPGPLLRLAPGNLPQAVEEFTAALRATEPSD